MISPDYFYIRAKAEISSAKFKFESHKENINRLEIERILAVIQGLKNDENRLQICIENIELLHRDMFILPYRVVKPSNTDNEPSVKDAEFTVTEPESSEDEPIYPMNVPELRENEPDFLIQRPVFSMNVQELHENEPDFLIQRPDCSIHEPDYSIHEPDCSFPEPDYSIHEPDCSVHEPDYTIHKPDSATIEPDCQMNEQNTSRGRIILKIRKSRIGMHIYNKESISKDKDLKNEEVNFNDESNYYINESRDKDEPACDNNEPSDTEKKFAKQIAADFLAYKEKEITESVLKLISTFSRFQRKLQDAEKSASITTRYFPTGSNVKLEKSMETLSNSVMELDQAVYEINEKYSEILGNLNRLIE